MGIARQALELNRVPPLKPFITIPRMAEDASGMVRDAIVAFVKGDSHLALVDVEGVSTRSEGEGLFRTLMIVPDAAGPDGDES